MQDDVNMLSTDTLIAVKFTQVFPVRGREVAAYGVGDGTASISQFYLSRNMMDGTVLLHAACMESNSCLQIAIAPFGRGVAIIPEPRRPTCKSC